MIIGQEDPDKLFLSYVYRFQLFGTKMEFCHSVSNETFKKSLHMKVLTALLSQIAFAFLEEIDCIHTMWPRKCGPSNVNNLYRSKQSQIK